MKGDFGEVDITVPRNRNASFEPKIVPKGETRFTGFDDKIPSLYARGMTTREIQSHLEEIYEVPDDQRLMEEALGAEHSLICFSARDS